MSSITAKCSIATAIFSDLTEPNKQEAHNLVLDTELVNQCFWGGVDGLPFWSQVSSAGATTCNH